MLRLFAIVLSAIMLGTSPMSVPVQSEAVETSLPQKIELTAFTVIGPFIRTTNAVEMTGKEGKIGPLWNQFMHGGSETIPGVIEPRTVYAVYTNYQSDETGAYDLVLGKSVQPEQHVPVSMKVLHIPTAQYLVFPAADNSPDAIKAAWMNVYRYFAQRPVQRRIFTYDFEQHSSTGTKIFIAIRRRDAPAGS